jgi:Putative prokaryotic signal transducing protein
MPCPGDPWRNDWCEGPGRVDGRAGITTGQLEEVRGVEGAPVSVAVVTSRTEAEMIVGLLRSHGLRAALATDDAGGQYPQLQLDGVRVMVAPSDEDEARQLLAQP